jgi:predicted HicB family RNase H-like nuclease
MQSSDAFGTVSNPMVQVEGEVRFDSNSVSAKGSAASSPARNENEKKRLAIELANFEMMAKEAREKLVMDGDVASRAAQVYQVAQQLFAAAPTWMAFYREILSHKGVGYQLFPKNEFRQFEATFEFNEIQKMITVLRAGSLPENDPMESLRMITVRLPLSLHKTLCDEAESRGVSVNQLCISRLLSPVADDSIPSSAKGRRGRRPGPQGPRRESSNRMDDMNVMEAKMGRTDESSAS